MTRPEDKYGSPLKYDPEFKGPQKRRSCTDVLCLLVFIVFLGTWAAVGLYAAREGQLERLFLPLDSSGHRCGENELQNKTNLFFFDISNCVTPDAIWSGCKTTQICIETCPKDIWSAEIYLTKNKTFQKDDQKYLICTDETIVQTVVDTNSLRKAIEDKKCASWYVTSTPVYHRCIPDIAEIKKELEKLPVSMASLASIAEPAERLNEISKVVEDIIRDLKNTWQYIVLFCLAALVVSLTYIALLRYLAGAVIWFSILALCAFFVSGIIFSYKNFSLLNNDPSYKVVPDSSNIEGKVNKLLNSKEFWLTLLVICSCLFSLIALIVLFLRNRIFIATALIKEGSKAVSCTVSTLFFPIIPWILQAAVLLWSLGIFLCLYSIGEDNFRVQGLNNGSCLCKDAYENLKNNDSCTVEMFNEYCHQFDDPKSHCLTASCAKEDLGIDHNTGLSKSNVITVFQMFNLFGFYWGIWFVTGLSQMILAGVFSTWYWTFNKQHIPFFTLTSSVLRISWFHLGTVAFGSLLIAICSFIRAMIEYIERKTKKIDNPVSKAIFCCCKCFFWCLQKFLCFVSRNAYIMCAIHGKNFCASAKDAFQLLMRNLIRVIFVDKVTDFLFFLGKLVVTASIVTLSYYLVFMKEVRVLDDSGRDATLVYPWIPMAIIGVLTYIMTTIFFSVYSIAVDTLFLCFLEDCERNDGSREKPYFMSKELMKILGKKNMKKKVQD